MEKRQNTSSLLPVSADNTSHVRSRSQNPKINGFNTRKSEDTGGSIMSDISFFPRFDGTFDSRVYANHDDDSLSESSSVSSLSSRSSD